MSDREARQERDYAGIVPHLEPLSAELNRDGGAFCGRFSGQQLSCS